MTHQFAIEILYHFNCGSCKGWWSYALTPESPTQHLAWGMSGKFQHCPHCGAEAESEIKENFFEKGSFLS